MTNKLVVNKNSHNYWYIIP